MADNIVTIQVRIDDKGNLSAVGNKAEQAAGKMDKASKSAGTLDRNMKGAGQASSGAAKNFSKISQGMGGFVGAYATLAANVFAVSAAFNFLKRAADVEQLRASQVEFARSSGTALQSVTERLREASGGMLGFQEAAQAAAIGSAKGFSPQQLEELAIGAGKVSKALGRDFTDSFDRLVRGISKAEPELLDELGITLRLEEATKRYAEALGKNAKELTTFERSQAVLVETQRQLNSQFGDFEGSDNAFVKLQKTFEDVVNMVMEKVLPVFQGFANVISNNIGLAIGIFAIIGAKIFSTIPAVAGLGDALNQFVEDSEEGMKQNIKDMEDYADSVAEAKKELKDAADKAETVFSQAKGGAQDVAKDLEARKGSGLEKLQKGEDPSQRQLAGMLKAARDNKGEYKKLDTEQRKHFIKQLEIMQNANSKTYRTMGAHIKRGGLALKGYGISIKKFVIENLNRARRVGIRTFAGIGKAAIGAGKVIRGAMKFTVIAGVFVGILEMLETITKFPYTFMKNMIEAVVGIGRTFQALVNGMLFGVNKVANAFRAVVGLAEQEQIKVEILDEKTADNIMAAMEANEGFVGEMVKSAKAVEEVNRAVEKYENGLVKLGEMSQTVAEDLQAVNQGLAGQGASAETSMKRMTAIGTAGISGLLNRALENATKDDGSVDMSRAKKGVEKIIEELGDEAKALSPELFKALGLPIEDAIEKISTMETQALEFTSATSQFSAQIEQVQKALGSGNLQAALELTKPLENQKVRLEEIAEKTNEVTDAQKTLDEAFAFAGGLDAYREKIRGLIAEEERLKTQRNEIAIQQANTALLTSGFAQRANEQLEITKAQNAVDQNALDIAKKRQLVEEAEKGKGQLAGKTEEITALEKEIEDQIELGKQLENNVRIAESKADDIEKLGLTIGNSLEENLSSAFNALVQGTKSFKDAFADMAKAILADIAKMITRMLVMRALTSAFGGTSFGNFLGIPTAKQGGIVEPPQYRYGGIAKMEDYSRGGIARGSQAGYPAVLHGTEAVVPLPDNRSIPVEMRGGMGTQNNVTVNVNIDNEGRTTQDSTSDGLMGENLGRLVASAVQDELHFQKRSGGILNPYGVA